MDFAQHTGQGHGAAWKGILFRQTFPQLSDVISKSKKWFHKIFPKAKYNEAAHHWTWPDGEMLLLRQFQRDNDYWNYHGHEYPWIGWEELTNWASPTGYKLMMSCCRSSRKGMPRKVRSTTNPYGVGHNWIKQRFQLPGMMDRAIMDSKDKDGNIEPPRMAIDSDLKENHALMDNDPNYLTMILSAARNDAERKAWQHGSWDIVAGGMFDDVWDPKIHQLEPFDIPAEWRITRAFDWGSSKPFSVGWWAESDGSDVMLRNGKWRSTIKGDFYRIQEWYGWSGEPNEGLRMLNKDISHGIIERELRWGLYGKVKAGPADGAIFTITNGTSVAMEMEATVRINGKNYRGATFIAADKRPGSRVIGWDVCRQRLKNAKLEEGKPREHPGLFIFNTCPQFLRTFPVLPRDDKNLDDVDTNAEDHIGDEARYQVTASGNRTTSRRTVGMT